MRTLITVLLLVSPFCLVTATAAPDRYDHQLVTAQALIDMGRAQRAVDLAASAAQAAPERPEAYVVWGRALASLDRAGEAVVAYERARTLGSRDRPLFVELSSLYDVQRAYDRAIAVYRDWLGKTPDDAEMQHELGLTLMLAGRFDDAKTGLRAAVTLQPDDLQMRQDLGYALLRHRDFAAAATEIEQVLQRDAKRPEALRLLAQAYAGLGRSREALPLLDRALAIDPRDERAQRVRARLRQLTGDAEGALGDYRALIAADATDAPALLGAAGALLALDRTNEAAPLVRAARDRLGDQPDVRFREAQIAVRHGERAALATLRELVDQVGNSAEVWREIAWAAKKLGDQPLAAEAAKHAP